MQYNNDTKALTDHVITLANAVDAVSDFKTVETKIASLYSF